LLLFCAAYIPAKVIGVVLRLDELLAGLVGLLITEHVSRGLASDFTGVMIEVLLRLAFFMGVALAD